MFGMEMMLKNMGLDPETIKGSIEGFSKFMVELNASLQRIEANQKVIMLHFGLSVDAVKDETVITLIEDQTNAG